MSPGSTVFNVFAFIWRVLDGLRKALHLIVLLVLFAALLLITAAGVALFLIVSLLARLALRGWHESELGR